MDIKTRLEIASLRKLYRWVDMDPKKHLPQLGCHIDRTISKSSRLRPQLRSIQSALNDPDGNWYRLLMDIFTNIDPGVRRAVFENLVINGTIKQSIIHDRLTARYNCNIPWAILLDPTSACNLHCLGCWAAEYGDKLNLTVVDMDDIICQGKELGCHFFLFSGGEPLVRKRDIIYLCKTHPDCIFSAFTNGTLIDEAFASDMLLVKNFIPAISVEGSEQSTDLRRGQGTYRRVTSAMEILRENHLPFGISTCYTSINTADVGSEEYFDQMIEWGAKFCWFFTYMPIGKNAVPSLMVTAEQRRFMYDQIRKFRKTKAIFTMDFWNDGEYSKYRENNGPGYPGGCIAGGRRYLHINAKGDIEPCAFIHYSDSNIGEKTLLEALCSPLFMGYRRNQPFNENKLRPCPVLDNPGALTRLVEESHACSTDYLNQESPREYSDKCVAAAQAWAPVADELWDAEH